MDSWVVLDKYIKDLETKLALEWDQDLAEDLRAFKDLKSMALNFQDLLRELSIRAHVTPPASDKEHKWWSEGLTYSPTHITFLWEEASMDRFAIYPPLKKVLNPVCPICHGTGQIAGPSSTVPCPICKPETP